MKLSDFWYDLPEYKIAQTPVEPRGHSRMLVVHGQNGLVEDRHFYDLAEYLRPGDALVLNETRVMPARLYGVRESGGAAEVLLLEQIAPKRWTTLVKPGKKLKPGAVIWFGGEKLKGTVLETTDSGGRVIDFECEGVVEAVLDELGEMPLPPYIHERLDNPDRYQTVYAKQQGSAAAPTAGLHFTQALLDRLEASGIEIIKILLHVGLGTFRPVKVEDIDEHHMHSEYYEISAQAAERINRVRAQGGRICAVGTTSVRTLESAAVKDCVVAAGSGWTDIFIRPGYHFKMVDVLITNFHLPGSTLLMLVSALIGRERTFSVYAHAVEDGYRFFSFGDAMLLIPDEGTESK